MLGKRGLKLHRGKHADDCPTRDMNPERNGVKHRGPCDDLPDQISEAEVAPKGQADSMADMFKAFQAFIGGQQDSEAVEKRRGPRRGPVSQPKAEKDKPKAKSIGIGDADTQPNDAWFELLENGLTTFGGSVALAKLNTNYGRLEFPDPSSYDDGNQILHNVTPFSAHGASLGKAKVGQGYNFMYWPDGMDIEDVLEELSE